MIKVLLPLLGAALLFSTSAAAQSAALGDVVQTRLGPVRGETVTDAGSTARIWRGIPYASAPVGELRWKPPQAAKPWTQVRDATKWPNRCPQGASNMGVSAPISEDCLYLNVVTAAKSPGEKRAVMVFYHGGGLTSGTGNSTTYNHPKLPNQGVVVVTVNSRLGPFGYLAHPALAAEGRGSGNYGTLDIRASLEWVRDNIAAFGGDPQNVTIFGESGGGVKVTSQLASPLSAGLFHRAIVQSGSALVMPQRSTTKEAAEARGVALAQALGAPQGPGGLAAMRAAKWEDVLAAATKSKFTAGVVVDGDVIPAPVHELFAQGRQNKVPLIVGANEGEASLRSDVPEMAKLHSASGAPTFVYNFSQLPLGWRREKGCVAFHGLELSYVFGAIPVGLTSPTTQGLARGGGCSVRAPEHDDEDVKVADQFSKIWAQFAKTGDPSTPGLIDWPKYTAADPAYLDIGAPLEIKRGVEAAYVAPPAGSTRVPGTPAP
ncbi:carboxylesterase/lipase family protein [Phenylobacterium sp.]|uniref:carboxylesterase/lipase family protein n=1 Tax=Phenylobacterium sp. TaxID=1871053 RepID=UPI002E2FF606|nr:carboxylesterase family protein [Phenylobacterium sp.]HEX2559628.1 carboxylesterase family protein [Phenylobacterium sp.]